MSTSAAEHLSPAFPERAAWGTAGKLRAWQEQALALYLHRDARDFLAVATPGAGKTTYALRIATELLDRGLITAITVVAPTEHLKTQWADAAARVGIHLNPAFSNSVGVQSREYDGVAVTYAQVATKPQLHRRRTEAEPTLVILDEIHHGGDAKSWGDGIREAFEPATRRLSLTGTPFRSDTSPIPFVRYEMGHDGILRSASDYGYGYAPALRDGVVRPVIFLAYGGAMRWRTRAGDEIAANLGEPMTKDQTAQAWRTALDPKGEWVPSVLVAADKRLSEVRRHVPDAGGLVIASNQTSARAYASHPQGDHRRGRDGRAVRRRGVQRPDRGVLGRDAALDGRGPDGVRGRRRAAPVRRASTRPPPRPRCSSRRRSAASCGPGAAARRPRSSCRRCPSSSATRRPWRRSATTPSTARRPTSPRPRCGPRRRG